jgi:hypothetical protein
MKEHPCVVCGKPALRSETCGSPACGYELRRRKYWKKRGDEAPQEGPLPHNESREETDDELKICLGKTRIKTLPELLEACEVDTDVWECYRFVANKWEMGYKDPASNAKQIPLFQVKAWFRKKIALSNAIAELAALREDMKAKAPKRPAVMPAGSVMLELSIPDLHLGKLAWAKETGWEDYDSPIAQRCFDEALENLLARTAAHRLSEIVLVFGNDLLNSDNRNHTTTRGTPQTSTDTRYQKTFRDARIMCANAIDRCRKIAPVRAVLVSGNHDELSVWHLGDSLECQFANTGGVVIDNAPTMRKYYKHGAVGIMWAHGDKGKHSNYPLLFARERNDIWGSTRIQEVHLGHLHQTRVQEFNGVRVRILPSLCAADAWHSEMGFVGAVRGAEAFVWHPEEGLIGTANYSVPTYRSDVKHPAIELRAA